MLKRRIVATLVVMDGIVVQSLNFAHYLPVGKPAIAMEFLDNWGIDEIILLDISATKNGRAPDSQWSGTQQPTVAFHLRWEEVSLARNKFLI